MFNICYGNPCHLVDNSIAQSRRYRAQSWSIYHLPKILSSNQTVSINESITGSGHLSHLSTTTSKAFLTNLLFFYEPNMLILISFPFLNPGWIHLFKTPFYRSTLFYNPRKRTAMIVMAELFYTSEIVFLTKEDMISNRLVSNVFGLNYFWNIIMSYSVYFTDLQALTLIIFLKWKTRFI